MSNIKFISHEELPEDQYTKEIAYLELNVPTRQLFVRKMDKNGGKFWTASSLAVTKDGAKKYYPSFIHDSSFLTEDIKKFLDERSWTKTKPVSNISSPVFKDEELPF